MAVKEQESAIVIPSNNEDFLKDIRGNYIPLPVLFHDKYGIAVPIERSHYNLNWDKTREELPKEKSLILPINLFTAFTNYLTEGSKGKKIYDGKGNLVEQSRINKILDEIFGIRDPWRAEHLDARFGDNTITYHKIDKNGRLIEATEPLEKCLMQDKSPGIDLDYWLRNPTSQGLPREDTPNGDLRYWHPRSGTVAWFGAYSDGAVLGCSGGPQDSGVALGVRAAKIFRL